MDARTARTVGARQSALMWVRVRIDGTGHETDVRPTAVRAGMTVIEDYPPHKGLRPRPTKYRTDLAGRPARPAARRTAATPAATPATTDTEREAGQ